MVFYFYKNGLAAVHSIIIYNTQINPEKCCNRKENDDDDENDIIGKTELSVCSEVTTTGFLASCVI